MMRAKAVGAGTARRRRQQRGPAAMAAAQARCVRRSALWVIPAVSCSPPAFDGFLTTVARRSAVEVAIACPRPVVAAVPGPRRLRITSKLSAPQRVPHLQTGRASTVMKERAQVPIPMPARELEISLSLARTAPSPARRSLQPVRKVR